jgi:hypothetical protein
MGLLKRLYRMSRFMTKGLSKIRLSQITWYALDNPVLEVPLWSSPIP